MTCFSLSWFEELLIWLVVIAAVFALVKLLVPLIIAPVSGVLIQALNIVVWAVVAIAIIMLVFELLSCLVGGLPRVR